MNKSFTTIMMLFWLLPTIALASNYSDSTPLPEKPAAAFVAPILDVINSGDAENIATFLQSNFTQEYLARFPLQRYVDFTLGLKSQHGKLTYQASRDYAQPLPEHELVAIVHSQNTELWYAITILTTPKHPGKVNRFYFSPANIPNNIEKPSTLSMQQAIAELDGYVQRMAGRDIFSGAVLLAKHEKVLFTAAHGQASKRFNVPNNLQTKFNLASMNKMFTALAIMQLVEAGKLALTDNLSKFVDETWLSKDKGDKIQVQHLLTHASGLGSYFNRTYAETSKNEFRKLDDCMLALGYTLNLTTVLGGKKG